jgi:hypothetical protein
MPLKPRLSALESNGNGGGGGPVLPSEVQIFDIFGYFPADKRISSNPWTIDITVGATTYNYPIDWTFPLTAQDGCVNFVNNEGANVLADTGFTVTYEGVIAPSDADSSFVLRFTGPDRDTFVGFEITVGLGPLAFPRENQAAAGGPNQTQVTDIWIHNKEKFYSGGSSLTGSADVVITKNGTPYTYSIDFSSGNADTAVANFITTHSASVLSDTGATLSSKQLQTGSDLHGEILSITGGVAGDEFTAELNNITDPTGIWYYIWDARKSNVTSPGGGGGGGTITFGYGNGTILYGYSKAGKEYITVLERKKFPKVIEVDDLDAILSGEFKNTIYVTSISGESLALNADKIISLLPKGTGSVVRYYSEGFGLKDFQVTEAPSAIFLFSCFCTIVSS